MEEWKDIAGYEGKYQVSNLGRVKSFYKNKYGKIRKLKTDKYGYKRINLSKDGKGKTYLVHRLVAEVFIPNPNNYPEVNHIDEDKTNNCIDNLEWCDSKYNNNYGTKSEKARKQMKGKEYPKSKKVKCITTGEIFESTRDIERKYNIPHSSISNCCKGKRKSAGRHPITGEKLVWEYV